MDNNEVTPVTNTIQSYKVLEAKAKAEAAELQKRLAMQNFRPCKLYPVLIYHDGLRWVCSYGAFNEQFSEYLPDGITDSGVVTYGMSPEEAMQNFDKLWCGIYDGDDDDDIEDEE